MEIYEPRPEYDEFIRTKKDPEMMLNKTQKSSALFASIFDPIMDRIDVKESFVIDGFSGTGTTSNLAILRGFKSLAIEMNPYFIPAIHERISIARAKKSWIFMISSELIPTEHASLDTNKDPKVEIEKWKPLVLKEFDKYPELTTIADHG
eukprot:Nk52_evm1s1776 gene=Nk52_evmTU1s1776